MKVVTKLCGYGGRSGPLLSAYIWQILLCIAQFMYFFHVLIAKFLLQQFIQSSMAVSFLTGLYNYQCTVSFRPVHTAIHVRFLLDRFIHSSMYIWFI